MKLFQFKGSSGVRLGAFMDKRSIDVAKSANMCRLPAPKSMTELMRAGKDGLARVKALFAAREAALLNEAEIMYAPAVASPEKILCVGLNYAAHTAETGLDAPKYPALFSKFSNALAAHRETIPLPRASAQIDYEAELVVVIGKEASDVPREEALSFVFGYTAGNDLSARDLQLRTSQWLLGKTLDHFAPVGPYIVPAEEISPNELTIRSYVNGELRQNGDTRDMIFDCASIVSYISRCITLKPGDLIFTGTPPGVVMGMPKERQIWLKKGDEVSVEIEHIGTLSNRLA